MKGNAATYSLAGGCWQLLVFLLHWLLYTIHS